MRIGGSDLVRALGVAVALSAALAGAQVPLDGFLPMVGIGLTDEFDENFNFFPNATTSPSGLQLGAGGTPHYDVALLDTGAGFSLLTAQAFDDFGLDEPIPGESDGFVGTEVIQVGGATGQLFARINDPFGLYVGGMQDRTSDGASLTMRTDVFNGQTNTSTLTFPADSDLPNVIGLPFASQYATEIRNDAPQVFELNGRTIRTPSINFKTLGSGGGDVTRKAPMSLNPGTTFAQPPTYLLNINDFDIDNPEENPTAPTLMQGALFVNASVSNNGQSLSTREFFFDTGASVTVLSEFNALLLGFDVTTDTPEFTVPVVGSGGTLQDVPGFFVDGFTVPALGGTVTFDNVPVLVLDVTDPSDPGNVVEGILGTNLFAGRNMVIDPNPSLGGGGASAGLYFSDPVTSEFNWSTAAASAAWSAGGSWDAAATPDYLSLARLSPTGSVDQVAVVSGNQRASDAVVAGGASGSTLTVLIESGASLTTFSGARIDEGGVVRLSDAMLDVQYLDVRGGTLAGSGEVRTGSGPIAGQVEVIGGVIAPGDGIGLLEIDGRLALREGSLLEFDLGGRTAGSGYDQLVVTGSVAIEGDLTVALDEGFFPAVGDEFQILTYEEHGGVFDSVDLPGGYQWNVDYGLNAVTLQLVGLGLDGDFNGDGTVDAADYTVWRDGFGTVYDETDYASWVANYGATAVSFSTSVPEPTAAFLVATALAGILVNRR